jgi:septal ring factor EnvC (AmiA/AmiB activator)
MNRKLVFCIFLLSVITGCATTSNPREGGFFGGVAGLSSGVYEERLKQREYDLAQQQSVNQDLKQESTRLKSYNRKLERELASLTEMDKKLSDLQKEIDHLKYKSDKQKGDIATLTQKIKKVRQQIKSQQGALEELDRVGGSTADPDRYRILKQEQKRLADEYDKLINYSKALHDAAK